MAVPFRPYSHATDYTEVGEFLIRTYSTTGPHINWLQPRWEYMHYHPLVRGVDLSSIGVWEAADQIAGLIHPEHSMGQAYIQIDPDHGELLADMLTHAEQHISTVSDGQRQLLIYINDRYEAAHQVATERGYVKGRSVEAMTYLAIPDPLPPIPLRSGFRLKSLADDNDLRKVDRVLWRGFDHGDEPPDDGIEDRKFMQSAPNYREDLNIVVEAPDGQFVAYCGMWYEPVHAIAYVEPLATDPDYRRMGLASAVVLEGIRRCGDLGATVAYVGSTLPVYLSLGFQPLYTYTGWQRHWSD